MPAIDAGRLFTRIDLERDVLTYAGGRETRTPEIYASVYAGTVDKGGSEVERGQTLASFGRRDFTIRYRTDVKPQHRVVWRGKRYEIIATHEDEEYRTDILLECQTYGG